jgi:hypothetical protein
MMYRVFLQNEKSQKMLKEMKARFEGCIWHSDEAIETVVLEYNRATKKIGFNAELLVLAFQEISRIYTARNGATSGFELSVRNFF